MTHKPSPYDVQWAVEDAVDRAVQGGVFRVVDWAVWGDVSEAVWEAVEDAVNLAVSGAVLAGPPHPNLQRFVGEVRQVRGSTT